MLIDEADSGLAEAEAEVIRLNEPDVDLYAWISGVESGYNGVAGIGEACGTKKSSLTRGPSRGVVETAEVN